MCSGSGAPSHGLSLAACARAGVGPRPGEALKGRGGALRTPGELAYLTGNTARLSFFTCARARVAGWALLRAAAARRCAVHYSVRHSA